MLVGLLRMWSGGKERGKSLPGLPARLPPPELALAVLLAGSSGLPPLLTCGVPFLLGALSLSFWRLRAPSLISPPEPASLSDSLPDPPPRRRLLGTFADLRGSVDCGAEDEGGRGGEVGREGGCRVLLVCTCACTNEFRLCFFFIFLRVDSLPLASELRGEPGRLSLEDGEGLRGSLCLEALCEGVLFPFEDVPEDGFAFEGLSCLSFSGLVLLSSAFFRSSSLRSSVSVSSDSL